LKALGIAFSARKKGNCLECIEYVLAKLKKHKFQTEIVNIYDLQVKPCSNCSYECFSRELRGREEKCPIDDDVAKIYSKMKEADIIVLAIPTYGGKPASLYCAFTERTQGIFGTYEEFKSSILNKIVALIVIGNVPAGGDLTYHMVISDYKDCRYPPPAILLQSAEYSKGSIYGNLLENENVKDRLDNLVMLILKDWKTKQ